MSATNRGTERAALDFYETPIWLTDAFLEHLPESRFREGVLLDAGCGTGAITSCLNAKYSEHDVVGIDIESYPEFSNRCFKNVFIKVNFLTYDIPNMKIAAIFMNPPYTLAQEFIQRALDITKGQVPIAALLRLNFAEGQSRAAWLRKLSPSIYITPRRPSFTYDGKTDATGYAWFLFDGKARVMWLDTEKPGAPRPVIRPKTVTPPPLPKCDHEWSPPAYMRNYSTCLKCGTIGI